MLKQINRTRAAQLFATSRPDDLTVADGNPTLGLLGSDGTTGAPYAAPAQGIWYAWDANSATLAGQAALVETDPDSYQSLLALEEVDVAIVPATPIYADATGEWLEP